MINMTRPRDKNTVKISSVSKNIPPNPLLGYVPRLPPRPRRLPAWPRAPSRTRRCSATGIDWSPVLSSASYESATSQTLFVWTNLTERPSGVATLIFMAPSTFSFPYNGPYRSLRNCRTVTATRTIGPSKICGFCVTWVYGELYLLPIMN